MNPARPATWPPARRYGARFARVTGEAPMFNRTQELRRANLAVEHLEDRLVPDATSFVTSLYQNLLNRAPDSGGLANYLQELQNGESHEQVATEIWRSPEHRGL